MPRTEVYQLRLTKSEKDDLAQKARSEGVSIAKLIRWRVGLDLEEPPAPEVGWVTRSPLDPQPRGAVQGPRRQTQAPSSHGHSRTHGP